MKASISGSGAAGRPRAAASIALGGKALEVDAPTRHADALELARIDGLQVEIFPTDESKCWLWAVSVVEQAAQTGFWMAARRTRWEAQTLCREMGRSVARRNAAPTPGTARSSGPVPCPLAGLAPLVAP